MYSLWLSPQHLEIGKLEQYSSSEYSYLGAIRSAKIAFSDGCSRTGKSEAPLVRRNCGRCGTLSGIIEVLDRVSGGTSKVLEDSAPFCKTDLGVFGLSSIRLKYVVDDFLEVIGVLGFSSPGSV